MFTREQLEDLQVGHHNNNIQSIQFPFANDICDMIRPLFQIVSLCKCMIVCVYVCVCCLSVSVCVSVCVSVLWRSNHITIFHLTGGLIIISPTTWWRWSQHSEDTHIHTHYSLQMQKNTLQTHTQTNISTHIYVHACMHSPGLLLSLLMFCTTNIFLISPPFSSICYCCWCCCCCRVRARLTTSRRITSRQGLAKHQDKG